MDSLVPVISVVVGGALTISGGYLNQITGHRRERLAENRARTANKLEDVGRLANGILKSGMDLRVRALMIPTGLKSDDSGIRESESNEFILILRLYEPSLLPEARALVDAEIAVGKSVVHQLNVWREEAPTNETYQHFSDGSQMLLDQLQGRYEDFMTALAARFSQYRL